MKNRGRIQYRVSSLIPKGVRHFLDPHDKDETSEWEKIVPQWVIADSEKLKEEGFKVQAAARFLIRRLGYEILKAEEDVFSPAKIQFLERKLGRHLARYSDYIVRIGRRLYVIDVKAKEFGILISRGQRHTLFNESIFLRRDYVDTVVPVLVLAILYPRGLFDFTTTRSKKVYYDLLSSIEKETRTAEGGIQIVLDHDLDRYRWIRPSTFRKWIRRTRRNAQDLIRMHS